MRNKGFTLIELVIVIIILGILAATTVPKFINLQQDAKQARLEGMKAAIESTIDIVYAKMAVEGLEDKSSVDVSEISFSLPDCGTEPATLATYCSFNFGYPSADFNTLAVLIEGISNMPGEKDWYLHNLGGNNSDPAGQQLKVQITPSDNVNSDGTLKENNCYLEYWNWNIRTDSTQAAPRPTVEIVACE